MKFVFYTFYRGTFSSTFPVLCSIFSLSLSHQFAYFFLILQPKILRLSSYYLVVVVVGFLTFIPKVFCCEKKKTKSNCNYPSLIKNFYHLACRQFFIFFLWHSYFGWILSLSLSLCGRVFSFLARFKQNFLIFHCQQIKLRIIFYLFSAIFFTFK